MDEFYTSDSAVDLVMDAFKMSFEVFPEDVIVEPSAVDGSYLHEVIYISTGEWHFACYT